MDEPPLAGPLGSLLVCGCLWWVGSLSRNHGIQILVVILLLYLICLNTFFIQSAFILKWFPDEAQDRNMLKPPMVIIYAQEL